MSGGVEEPARVQRSNWVFAGPLAAAVAGGGVAQRVRRRWCECDTMWLLWPRPEADAADNAGRGQSCGRPRHTQRDAPGRAGDG